MGQSGHETPAITPFLEPSTSLPQPSVAMTMTSEESLPRPPHGPSRRSPGLTSVLLPHPCSPRSGPPPCIEGPRRSGPGSSREQRRATLGSRQTCQPFENGLDYQTGFIY